MCSHAGKLTPREKVLWWCIRSICNQISGIGIYQAEMIAEWFVILYRAITWSNTKFRANETMIYVSKLVQK